MPSLGVDRAVAAAQGLEGLVRALRVEDPQLAEQIEGKALIASKGPIGVVLTTTITAISTRYGLGLDEGTCAVIDLVVLTAASYVARLLTTAPIAGLVKSKT